MLGPQHVDTCSNTIFFFFFFDRKLISLPSESLHVSACPGENVFGCDARAVRTPVDVSSTITIALDRRDSGTTFWCEAQLDLGPDGPQPKMASGPLNITVYCEFTFLLGFRIAACLFWFFFSSLCDFFLNS